MTNSTGIQSRIRPEDFESVWSATPTPFTSDWRVDKASVKRLVNHHLRLGVKGLFLGGTCGEGAWMPERERRILVETAVAASKGRLGIAVQVSDNSALRILDNIAMAAEDGADLVVIAPPHFMMNATPANIQELYLAAIRGSTLPVCFYDLGQRRNLFVPPVVLKVLLAEPNVVAVKDSSGDAERMKICLSARRKRPQLRLLAGDEFQCAQYLQDGYDGLMLGGAAFHGYLAEQLRSAVVNGRQQEADDLQARINQIMYAVYGGKSIKCWLAGEKKMLMELGVFKTCNNFPNFSLTASCVKSIESVVKKERDVLLPQMAKRQSSKP